MLDVKNVCAFYGDFQVLYDVSIKVENKGFVTVFGPNGHGKSTLLKTICGLVKPATGTIFLDKTDITKLSTPDIVDMRLVYIAEDRHLFPEMTVLENLKLGAYNKGARQQEARNLDYVCSLFPILEARKKKQAQTLSGGEARMLAIGRGLMSNATFLAIDEPSVGLAPNLREEVFEVIRHINNDGISMLLVEQDIVQVADYSNTMFMIEDGRIVFEGDRDSVLEDQHVKEVFLGM